MASTKKSDAIQERKLSLLLTFSVLSLACVVGFASRLFSVFRYGSMIHEYDPWFNYRATKYMVDNGFYNFMHWFDDKVWYPLGRHIGDTTFPGLMVTSSTIHYLLQLINFPIDIHEICVFMGPLFSCFTVIATYFLTKEVWSASAGLFAACFISIVPGYMSRSVAGSYDYESTAIFCMIFTYYLWIKAVKTGTIRYGAAAALAYFYMVATWGGYVYIINLIPLHVLGLLVSGRYSHRLYIAYSTFYPLATILSMQIPVVGSKPLLTSEHAGALGVFGLIQLIAFDKYIRSKLSKRKVQYILRLGLYAAAGVSLILFLLAVYFGKIAPFTGRFYSLLVPSYAKSSNPLIASVSEHQPARWSSYQLDLHFLIFAFPVGLYYCFSKLSDSNILIIVYGLTSFYFSTIMVRLILILAPVMCILGGIACSEILSTFCTDIYEENISSKKKDRTSASTKSTKKSKRDSTYPYKSEIGYIVAAVIAFVCVLYVRHCIWAASEVYSSPSIVLAARGAHGERIIFDDFREAYNWLRTNTDEKAIVMSWWDYGYQLNGMANRTTIVDNNTWNNSHIARVGQAMASDEDHAYKIMKELDVDYVMVVFGGLVGYPSDDINKLLWMVRIGGSTPEGAHINERDYFNENGEFRVDRNGSSTLLNSMMYKLCYYRFGSVYTQYGLPAGFDRVRYAEIGNKHFELKHLEEVYTSEHWLVRIFRVKKPSNSSETFVANS